MDDPPLRPTELVTYQPFTGPGNMERFNILRNHLKFYTNVEVTAIYSVPRALFQRFTINGIECLIYAALKETLNHQPIMGVTIEDEGTNEPKWERLSTIDLREVVKVISVNPNANPDNWVQDQHRVPIARKGDIPLWRVVVAFQNSASIDEESHVFFAVGFFGHHAIADGLSCGAFHLTFLDALNAVIASPLNTPLKSDDFAIVAVPKLPLLPNLEMKATLSVSVIFLLVQVFRAYIYNPIDPLSWSGPFSSAETTRPPISNTRSFWLPPSLVNKLVAKCRAEKTTITALVTVLVARKLAIMYPAYKRFTGTVPFSLRKFTGHSARDMGCYVSNVESYFSSEANPPRGYISCASSPDGMLSSNNDDTLWESARACKKLVDEKTSTTHNQNVNMLKFVSDLRKYFLGLLGTKRQHAFEVSNIGVVDGGAGGVDEEKASFDRVVFSASPSTYAQPYNFCLATAKNGYITVALVWEAGIAEDDRAKDLLNWLEGELMALAEE